MKKSNRKQQQRNSTVKRTEVVELSKRKEIGKFNKIWNLIQKKNEMHNINNNNNDRKIKSKLRFVSSAVFILILCCQKVCSYHPYLSSFRVHKHIFAAFFSRFLPNEKNINNIRSRNNIQHRIGKNSYA